MRVEGRIHVETEAPKALRGGQAGQIAAQAFAAGVIALEIYSIRVNLVLWLSAKALKRDDHVGAPLQLSGIFVAQT